MNKIITYILTLLALTIVISVGTVFAYKGDPTQTGPFYDEEKHEAMLKAFEQNDYDAWYELMTQDGRYPKILEKINEDNFETFVELRQARLEHDTDKIQELEQELGLNQGFGRHQGHNGNFQKGHHQGNCINN